MENKLFWKSILLHPKMIRIPLLDVSGPPRRGQGEKIHASKKAYKFKRIVKKVFGGFDVTRGGPQDGRRTESLHFLRVFCDVSIRRIFTMQKASEAHNPFQK